MPASKADRWATWLEDTLLADIRDPERPDPVPFLTCIDGELTTTEALDSYRYGKNDGEYLYLLYLADQPIESAADVTPVYVGESRNIGSRIYQHYKQIHDALPVADWEDDGSWGSFSKYDHIAAIRDRFGEQLYIWILDVDTLEACPYGFETYRQELEAKLIGLIYAQPTFRPTLTNREFVPNRVLHEIGKAGSEWLAGSHTADALDGAPAEPVTQIPTSKAALWTHWLDSVVYPDLADETTADPIPLFETDAQGRVALTETGRLKRSAAIDARIRAEASKCVHTSGVTDEGYEGLLYILYQLADTDAARPMIVPRYIGKAEAYGKKRELSSNFVEIARARETTKSFARWGDGDYWHVGELSMTLFEGDSRKVAWASELFEQGTRQLKEPLYLWTRAWHPARHVGPYGYHGYLAEIEPQLIGVAQAAYPEHLLNKSDVPDDAPIHRATYAFETVPNRA